MEITNEIIAQVLTTLIAFAIFAWFTKKLFWKPLLSTIDERQAKIKGEFDKIDAMQRQVDQLQADYSKRMADIEAEARLKLQEAMAQGKQIAEQVAEQARKDAETTRLKAEQTLAIELDKAKAELKQDVAELSSNHFVVAGRLDEQRGILTDHLAKPLEQAHHP